MLEKIVDLLRIVLEKYLIPALIAIFLTILSVNFFTKDFQFLGELSKTENYLLQYLFYFLTILLVYTIIRKIYQKYESNHRWDAWDKEFQEDLINEIDAYPEGIRNLVKGIFNNQNTPVKLRTDFWGAKEMQSTLRDKVIFSKCDDPSSYEVYLCRFTDSFYKRLCQLKKDYGLITHY